jgi:hypothetical protein
MTLFGCYSTGSSGSRGAIRVRMLEEQRQLGARRALERECASLRRQHSALVREVEGLRQEQERQAERLGWLEEPEGMTTAQRSDCTGMCDGTGAAALRSENACLVEKQRALLRRNAELECELETGRLQFARLLEAFESANARSRVGYEATVPSPPKPSSGEGGGVGDWERL